MDGDSERFDIVGPVGSSSEIGQVELDLIPALVEPHGHGTDEGFDPRGRLVVGRPEAPADVLVVQHLHLEREVFFQLIVIRCVRTFLMIITRNGSLIPKVSFSFAGQVTNAVVTFVPMISSTDDWMS